MGLPDVVVWVAVAWAVVLGASIGSFLNVALYRIPNRMSVVRPPSACPACGSRVRPRDNVPVLSWLILRGRCRDCGAAISPAYPAVEAGVGIAFGLVVAVLGFGTGLPFVIAAGVGALILLGFLLPLAGRALRRSADHQTAEPPA